MANNSEKTADINTATIEELSTVSGFGPAIAKRIIEGRPYETLDDLTKVKGIGSQFLDRLRPHLAVAVIPEQEVQGTSIDISIESEPLPEIETLGALPEIEEIQAKIDAETMEQTESEPKVEETDRAELKKVEPEVDDTEKEPLIAVGEASQSVFYPAEPEEKEGPEKVSRAIQVIEQKEKEEKLPEQKKKTLNRREMLAWIAGAGLISTILSILIILGIFGIVNGSLHYLTAQQGTREITALQSQLSDVEAQINIIDEDIAGLRTRLDTLESFGVRISTLEDQTETLNETLVETKDQLNETAGQVEDISGQMDIVTEEIIKIKEASSLFENFLKGLQSLLNEAIPIEPAEGVQP